MSQPPEQATRDAFGEALLQAGQEHNRLVVVSCDLASATRTKAFADAYPDRFFEVGIAEQNGIGVAAGLALAGFRPFISSFGAFITARYDQIKTSGGYNHAGMVIVGTHSGLAIGKDGGTQMGIEDINLMAGIPGMHIFQPADAHETKQIVQYLVTSTDLAYLRLSRTPQPRVLPDTYTFGFNKAVVLREGADVALLATGDTVLSAMQSAELLTSQGVRAAVVNFSTLKPLDVATIHHLATVFPLLVTVEDHNIVGGLGSRVCEIVAENQLTARVVRIGIPDCFGESGSPAELYRKYGLDAAGITATVLAATTRKKSTAPASPPRALTKKRRPLVTYHTVTWNRLDKLQNLLKSFIACNQYENFEWILIDHGSTDGTIEFLQQLPTNPEYRYLWGRTQVLIFDEQDYSGALREKGIELNSSRRVAQALFGKYRNDARLAAHGDYFIDIPDDHQFIRKSDWVTELLAIYDDRLQRVGRDDISALVFKTRRLFRILKRNQATEPRRVAKVLHDDSEQASNVEYYVCRFKGYDDYGMVSRSVASQMGLYWQIDYVTDPSVIAAWNDPKNAYFNRVSPHYNHYLEQSRTLGLKKVMVKYPYTQDLMNDATPVLSDALAVPLTTTAALRQKFYSLDRPVSYEELASLVTPQPSPWPLLKTKLEAHARALVRS